MNIPKEIKNYVKKNLKKGHSKEQINNALLSSGYGQDFATNIINEYSEKKQLNTIWVYIFLILLVSLSVFFIKPSFIGYVTVSKEVNYSEELNLVINSSDEYIWVPINKGEIKSIRLSGTVENRGNAAVYIENDNVSYKLFDSSDVEGLILITGAAAEENISDDNITTIKFSDVCEETCLLTGFINGSYKLVFEINNSIINVSAITYSIAEETEKFRISILLINSKGPIEHEIIIYKENTLIDDKEVEAGLYELEVIPSKKVIENIIFRGVNVSANFSGKIGIDNITGVLAEGIDAIKSFAVDPSGIEFKNASLKAIAKAPVLYKCKEWNFTEQKCYGNWTKIMDLDVGEEYEFEIDQNDPGFIEGFPEEENNAPVCSIIQDIIVAENSSYSFEFGDYCSDADGDALSYLYNPAENITINIDGSIAIIIPDNDFTGVRYTFFIVNDSEDVYVSNIVKINVSESYEEKPEKTVKGFTVSSVSDEPALSTMNIQGRLTSANNTNLNGDYNFTFRIYNISTGGSAIWEENHSLNVNDGVYDAIMGSIVPIELEFDEPYYIGMSVNNDNEMSPRLNLTSAPYSRRAVMAENLTCVGCVAAGEILNRTITTADISSSAGILETQLEKTFVDTSGDVMTGNLIGTGVNISYLNVSGTALINILNVTGSTNIGNINISGVSFAEGDISVNNNVNITSDGNVQLSQNLTVGQDGYFGGSLDIGTAIKIGTTSTTNNGTIRFNPPLFQGYNGTDWVQLSGSGASTQWISSGANIYYSTGNVGVGTTTPTAKLDVAGTINGSVITVNGVNVGLHSGISGENITSGTVADSRVTDDLTIASTKTINTTAGLNVSGGAYIGGNVGIGIPIPNERLTVIGNANITGTVYAHNFSGNSDIVFINNTGEIKMIIKDNGYIGIGTITPSVSLDVAGIINGSVITVNGVNVGLHSGISGENITSGTVADSRVTDDLTIASTKTINTTGGLNVTGGVYIKGNVGIGTISPIEKLDVSGAIKIGTTTSANTGTIRYLNHAFQGYNGTDWLTLSGGSVSGTGGWTDDGSTVRLTTLSDNVGIGIANPVARLHINGTGITLNISNATHSHLYVDSAKGYIGIGTTSPAAKLHISSADGIVLPIGTTEQRPNSPLNGTIRFNTNSSQFEGFSGTWGSLGGLIDVDMDTYISAETSAGADNDELRFYTKGAEVMRILNNGRVGINTTSPSTNLHINGTFSVEYGGTQGLYQDGLGNVGIGTTSPNKELTVVGDMNITGDITLSAGGNISSTSNANIYIDAGSGEVIFGDGTGKIDAGTIDPLFNIMENTYATYVPSILGVKEEITGKAKTTKNGEIFSYIIDFDKERIGTDLWVWSNIIDFNKDNIEAIATPYGEFANIYYYIENKKIIFVSDKDIEFSYRLTGSRFDHNEWPTYVPDKKGVGFNVREYNSKTFK